MVRTGRHSRQHCSCFPSTRSSPAAKVRWPLVSVSNADWRPVSLGGRVRPWGGAGRGRAEDTDTGRPLVPGPRLVRTLHHVLYISMSVRSVEWGQQDTGTVVAQLSDQSWSVSPPSYISAPPTASLATRGSSHHICIVPGPHHHTTTHCNNITQQQLQGAVIKTIPTRHISPSNPR